jgi:hypothetical protein
MANKSSVLTSSTTEDISIGDDGIDMNGRGAILQPNLSEEELEKQKKQEEYKEELAKIQEDIATLRLVLNDKLKRENELKTLLGVSFVDEIKQDFSEGLNQIKSFTAIQKASQSFSDLTTSISQTNAYQRTTAGLKSATQAVTPAFASIGGTMKNSLSNLRNSTVFKSFETGISSTTARLKTSKSEFINTDGNQNGNSMTTSRSTLGTTSVNGVTKHETILEDREKN